jgi:hypothetical protein
MLFFFPCEDATYWHSTRFSEIAGTHFSQIHILSRQIENLVRTRDLLLPRLISGKLSVENLDIQFPLSMAEEMKTEPTTTAHASWRQSHETALWPELFPSGSRLATSKEIS